MRVPHLDGGCRPPAHSSSGVSRFHASWPFTLSSGRGELCGLSPPGAGQALPLLVSFLVLLPLLSWSGQDGHLLWSLDLLWLSSGLEAPRIRRNEAQSRCVCGQLCMCSQPVVGCSEVCVCARYTQRTHAGARRTQHADAVLARCRRRTRLGADAPSYLAAADSSLPFKSPSLPLPLDKDVVET